MKKKPLVAPSAAKSSRPPFRMRLRETFVGVAPNGDAYMAIGERVLAFRAAGIDSADLPPGVVDAAVAHLDDVGLTNLIERVGELVVLLPLLGAHGVQE